MKVYTYRIDINSDLEEVMHKYCEAYCIVRNIASMSISYMRGCKFDTHKLRSAVNLINIVRRDLSKDKKLSWVVDMPKSLFNLAVKNEYRRFRDSRYESFSYISGKSFDSVGFELDGDDVFVNSSKCLTLEGISDSIDLVSDFNVCGIRSIWVRKESDMWLMSARSEL